MQELNSAKATKSSVQGENFNSRECPVTAHAVRHSSTDTETSRLQLSMNSVWQFQQSNVYSLETVSDQDNTEQTGSQIQRSLPMICYGQTIKKRQFEKIMPEGKPAAS